MYGTLPDLLVALLRHALTFIAGIIVTRGWVDAETATQLVGGLVGVIGILFSAFFHAGSNGTIPTQSVAPNMSKQVDSKTVTTENTQVTSSTPAIAPGSGTVLIP